MAEAPSIDIHVCLNHRGEPRPSCMGSGSKALRKQLKEVYGEQVKPFTCFGRCSEGPVVRVQCGKREQFIACATLETVTSAVDQLQQQRELRGQ